MWVEVFAYILTGLVVVLFVDAVGFYFCVLVGGLY